MQSGYRNRLGSMVMVSAMMLLAVVAGACSSGSDETLDLLNDPKIGLSHLNAVLHTVKGRRAAGEGAGGAGYGEGVWRAAQAKHG
jgi:hypothetical protein